MADGCVVSACLAAVLTFVCCVSASPFILGGCALSSPRSLSAGRTSGLGHRRVWGGSAGVGEGTRVRQDAREARGTHRKATEKAGRGRPASRRQWEGEGGKREGGERKHNGGTTSPAAGWSYIGEQPGVFWAIHFCRQNIGSAYMFTHVCRENTRGLTYQTNKANSRWACAQGHGKRWRR